MLPYNKVIGIHGVPRSGTSWLAQIINSDPNVNFKFQPLFSYAFKDFLNEKSSLKEIEDFFIKIYYSNDYFLNLQDSELHKNYPKFIKNKNKKTLVFKHVRYHHLLPHLMYECQYLELILIVRNPLAVLTSWANAPKEFNKEWVLKNEWKEATKKNNGKKEEFFGYNKWKEATIIFEKLKKTYPNRVAIIKYNELLNDAEGVIKQIFGLHKKTSSFIRESRKRHDKDPNSVYKKKLDDNEYANFLPKEIINTIVTDLRDNQLSKYL